MVIRYKTVGIATGQCREILSEGVLVPLFAGQRLEMFGFVGPIWCDGRPSTPGRTWAPILWFQTRFHCLGDFKVLAKT